MNSLVLPDEIVSKIMLYNSHPVADIVNKFMNEKNMHPYDDITYFAPYFKKSNGEIMESILDVCDWWINRELGNVDDEMPFFFDYWQEQYINLLHTT